MTVHILKMAVGVESVDHLRQLQAQRLSVQSGAGEPQVLRHWTRNRPKRSDEIVNGGSLYWIIKGNIRARQLITAIERRNEVETTKNCGFVLDPLVVSTVLQTARPIQGWRYLETSFVPQDKDSSSETLDDMSEGMATELRVLGLL
ncbi:MAG: lysophospholipase [Rhodospirillaceae bacterium]|nr:lysophospholipase [Rhodospirillaceae bacterium]|tara:strand:+ start:311 stop:748 length:438 start_codon:yes stop_codon:yes gene_type:complete